MGKLIKAGMVLLLMVFAALSIVVVLYLRMKMSESITDISSASIETPSARIREFSKHYITYSSIIDVQFLIHVHTRPLGPNSTENSYILLKLAPKDIKSWIPGYIRFTPNSELRSDCVNYIKRYMIFNSTSPLFLRRNYSCAVVFQREGYLLLRNENE